MRRTPLIAVILLVLLPAAALATPDKALTDGFVGCSSSGEIFGTTISDASLSVGVLRLDTGSVGSALAPVRSADESYAAGQTLANKLNKPLLERPANCYNPLCLFSRPKNFFPRP